MAEGKISFSPIEKAIRSLEDIHRQKMDVYRRDGAIQRFEYTFELAWKLMQRVLKYQGIETGSPKQVFRAALKVGLIDDVKIWFSFLEKRNLTVHTYNEDIADEVFEASRAFISVAKGALKRGKVIFESEAYETLLKWKGKVKLDINLSELRKDRDK